ncbi:MAG: aldo/keto reductase [Planctomycetaceae bacterium]
MEFRPLGSTGISVSAVSFGAGPVSGLMTGSTQDRQVAVVRRAIESGINWFDTAATYGGGQSEQSLGAAFAAIGRPADVHIATKVRLMPEHLGDIGKQVRKSFAESLLRLGVARVTLLQLHNSITPNRGDEPTSITPEDILGPGGVLEAFERLRSDGLVEQLGLTGIGNPESLRLVVRSGKFATMQIPYHILNPSAGEVMPEGFAETNYGNVISDCAEMGMGVFAIRVFAGGALLDQEPSAHTLKTPFFPLALYERDRARSLALSKHLGNARLEELAVRFVLSHRALSSAIIGFGDPAHVDSAVESAAAGGLSNELLAAIRAFPRD